MVDVVSDTWRKSQREAFIARRVPAALVLKQEEVALLLVAMARADALDPCPVGRDCGDCNTAHALWWNLCNALDTALVLKTQAFLRAQGTPLPAGAWTEE